MVDAIVHGSTDSLLLQQTAHLTSGFYLRLDEQESQGLSQHLLTRCLPGQQTRGLMAPPTQAGLGAQVRRRRLTRGCNSQRSSQRDSTARGIRE